jgi:hypothetical protein
MRRLESENGQRPLLITHARESLSSRSSVQAATSSCALARTPAWSGEAVKQAQAKPGQLVGEHPGLAGKDLAGGIDATLQDQAGQLACGLIDCGDGGLRVAFPGTDLRAHEIGGARDMVGGNGAQGVAQGRQRIAFHGISDLVGGKIVEQGLHLRGGGDELFAHHFLADRFELAGGQETVGHRVEADRQLMRGALLAVERAHPGEQAVHLLVDLGEVVLAGEEGDAARIGARAVRAGLAGILVGHLDHEGTESPICRSGVPCGSPRRVFCSPSPLRTGCSRVMVFAGRRFTRQVMVVVPMPWSSCARTASSSGRPSMALRLAAGEVSSTRGAWSEATWRK